MIIFHMVRLINGAVLGSGRRFRMDALGGSVANANAANVSIMRLTQRSCTAVNTEDSSPLATAEINVRKTAVMLTVI